MAIALVVVAWPLVLNGTLTQMGDPAPTVARADIEASRQISSASVYFLV